MREMEAEVREAVCPTCEGAWVPRSGVKWADDNDKGRIGRMSCRESHTKESSNSDSDNKTFNKAKVVFVKNKDTLS